MERTFQKAILRRGITFGPELTESDATRGLLFVSYQTSIAEQFEFLMRQWVNSADRPHAAAGEDPILTTQRKFEVRVSDGKKPFELTVPGGWVFATGGAYLLAPGLRFFTQVL